MKAVRRCHGSKGDSSDSLSLFSVPNNGAGFAAQTSSPFVTKEAHNHLTGGRERARPAWLTISKRLHQW